MCAKFECESAKFKFNAYNSITSAYTTFFEDNVGTWQEQKRSPSLEDLFFLAVLIETSNNLRQHFSLQLKHSETLLNRMNTL